MERITGKIMELRTFRKNRFIYFYYKELKY